jgi:arabinose-5-phosphate isomerase
MREMSAKGLGASAVVDEAGAVLGIFTDGDLRRLIEPGADLRGLWPARSCTPPAPHPPRCPGRGRRQPDGAAQHHQRAGLRARRYLVGIVHIGDLMRAKVI